MKKNAFLIAFAILGNITAAADAADCHRSSHYRWMGDKEYAVDFGLVRREYIDKLEEEADRRAVEGVDEPVFFKDEVVGYKRKYSDLLLIFRLKALDPEKYRERSDNKHDHEHHHSGKVEVSVGEVVRQVIQNAEATKLIREKQLGGDDD